MKFSGLNAKGLKDGPSLILMAGELHIMVMMVQFPPRTNDLIGGQKSSLII